MKSYVFLTHLKYTVLEGITFLGDVNIIEGNNQAWAKQMELEVF